MDKVKNNNILILIDYENLGVYCAPDSYSHANALKAGLINAGIFELPAGLPWIKKYDGLVLGKHDSHYQFDLQTGDIYPMPKDLITADWVERRNLVLLKYNFFMIWDFRTRRKLVRIYDSATTGIMEGYLWDQYRQCKPEENIYTPAIQEFADLSEIPVENAYQELKMRSETIGLTHLRYYALYQKYINKLHKCKTKDELQATLDEGVKEVELKAWL